MLTYREPKNLLSQQANKGGSTGSDGALKASVKCIDQVTQVGWHYLSKDRVVTGWRCPDFQYPHGDEDAGIYDYGRRLPILW